MYPRPNSIVFVFFSVLMALLVGQQTARAQFLQILGSGGDHSNGGYTGNQLGLHPDNWLYASGTMGGGGTLLRVDISNPSAIGTASILSNEFSGGIAVNPVTGRYASTSGFGSQLRVYNPDTTVYDTESITGCGGIMTSGNGTFGISTQCVDRFHIYDEALAAITFVGSGAVGGSTVYSALTSRYYHNKNGPATFVNEFPAHNPGTLSNNEHILGSNSVTGRLYGIDKNTNNYIVLDAVTHNLLNSVTGFPDQYLTVDESRNLIYTSMSTAGLINIRDADSGTVLNSFALTDGWMAQQLLYDGTNDVLFAVAINASNPGINRVFAMRASSIPEPGAGLIIGLVGLALAGARRNRRLKSANS